MSEPGKAKGQLEAANIDLVHRPRVKNADGSVSTVLSASFGIDGHEVLLPLVSDDGRIMSNDEALDTYKQTGKHLGVYKSVNAANAAAKRIHEEQAQMLEADAATSAGPQVATRVPVVVSDGSVQTIDPKDLPAALDQGWSLASPQQVQQFRDAQKYESVSAQARTAGEAALRGLTIGLSDKAMQELGVDMEGVSKRKELNPITSTVGEVAGVAAPLLLTGGAAGAADAAAAGGGGLRMLAGGLRAAGSLPRAIAAGGEAAQVGLRSLLGESVLARGAAAAGAGALEGGIYGAGQAVSEAALKDVPLTAERLAMHVGTGALFGGVPAGVLGTAGAAVEKRVLPWIKKELTPAKIETFVEEHGLRQWAQGRGKSLFKKLRQDFGDDAPSQIGRVVRDEGLDQTIATGATWQEIHQLTQQKVGNAGRRIGQVLKEIDAAAPGSAREATERIAAQAREAILEPLTKSGLASDRKLSQKLEREFEWLWTDEAAIKKQILKKDPKIAGEALTAETAKRILELQDQFAPNSFERLHQLRARIDDVAFPKGPVDATPYQAQLQKLRAVVEDEITTAADTAAKKIGGNIAGAYGSAKQRYRALKWLDGAAENNAASDMANRQFSLTDNLWGSAVTSATMTRLLAGDVSALGSMVIAGTMGVGAGMLNRFMRAEGQQMMSRGGQKILQLLKANENAASRIDQAAERFFAKAPIKTALPAAAAGGSIQDQFSDRTKQLDSYALAPDGKLNSALGDTRQTAPSLDAEIRQLTQRGYAFLESKRPRRRARASEIRPLSTDKQRVSNGDAARFNRYFDAVSNPGSQIEAFERGRLSREGAEALRAVYPRLHQQLTERVQEHLAAGVEAPREKLIQLSLLLGSPMHPTMEPSFIAMCQGVYAAQRQEQQQRAQHGRMPAPNGARAMATESQRLEAST